MDDPTNCETGTQPSALATLTISVRVLLLAALLLPGALLAVIVGRGR